VQAFQQGPPTTPPQLIAPTDPLTPEAERRAFRLPAGFEIQLVAAEPAIDKPIQMAFDGRGRLWVTTSRHYPFPAEPGKACDKVYIVSDIDPQTGRAGSVQVFADDLNIPIGVLPLPDGRSAIISSCGEIRRYTDRDGDGRADHYQVLFNGFGYRDTHGMYNSFTWMPDGWIYACHGFANESTVTGRDGHTVRMHSGHTFRFRPDGSSIEIFTYGQVNPFGMAIDPYDRLYTADCHSRPITQLIPQAYYDSFGKPHDGLGFAPHVTRHDHGSTALCGLVWYQADHYPAEWNAHMFLGNVVTNRINCDRIIWKGSTPVAEERPDFLISSDPWFRPVDLKLGPDGALYVADFYNRIIGHYEVDLRHPGRDRERGRIWRIIWRGTQGQAVAPPHPPFRDLITANSEQLLGLARHSNLTVRWLARQQLAHRFPQLLPQVYPILNPDTARRQLLNQHEPHQLRKAVEYLIMHPQADALPQLLALLRCVIPEDTHLRHAIRIALRNTLRDAPNAWEQADEHVHRHPNDLAHLVDILAGLPTAEAADFLIRQWQRAGLTPEKLEKHCQVPWTMYLQGIAWMSRHARPQALTALLPILQPSSNRDSSTTLRIANSFYHGQQGRPRAEPLFPPQLEDLVKQTLQAPQPAPEQLLALETLHRVRPLLAPGPRRQGVDRWATEAVVRILQQPQQPIIHRQQAANIVLRDYLADAQHVVIRLLEEPTTPAVLREQLVVGLAAQPLTLQSLPLRDAMLASLRHAPYRVVHTAALALATNRLGAEFLLNAVQHQQLTPVLLQDRNIRERLQAHRLSEIDKRLGELTRQLPPVDQKMQELIRQRAQAFSRYSPDPLAGQRIFMQHCALCHRVGQHGGTAAPQLDGIGHRGPERLIEDILDPNRNVDPTFRAHALITTDERTFTGLVIRKDADVVVVLDSTGQEVRLAPKDIATIRATSLSPMPANFAQILNERDLFDLLAFLLQQKASQAQGP
jgi:putative heme-binding domain-containing protein